MNIHWKEGFLLIQNQIYEVIRFVIRCFLVSHEDRFEKMAFNLKTIVVRT